MKSAIKLILAAAVVALSACQKEEASAPSNFPKDGVIRIATNVEIPTTRGGITTDNLRMFSINIENTASTEYSYFGIFEKENDVWNCYADVEKKPLTMLWQNNIQPITVTAISIDGFLLQEGVFFKGSQSIWGDQIEEEQFKHSDILYMAPTVIDPAKAEDLTTDGKIPVTFKHLLSKVNLSLTLGTEFNITPGTTPNPINNLNIKGTKGIFKWEPLVSGMLELTGAKPEAIAPFVGHYTAGNAATATIAATKAVATYEAILVPQTVAEKGFSVSFVIDGKPYTWTSNDAITLEQGKQHTLALTVGKDAVTLSGFTVTEWEVGGKITGGKALTTTANPTTHTVHLVKEGELTGELIATAIGSEKKDLKITGAMGTADFATLLSWGTKGHTDNDVDLFCTLDLTGVTGLTAVPDYAFYKVLPDGHRYSLRSLQRIDLPTTVTSVGKYAFYNCDKLTTVSAPELQTVETNAFFNGYALAEFTATKLLTVGEGAFRNCDLISTFTAPKLQTVVNVAFQNCTSLASFTAPELHTVGEKAFNNCSLLASFTAPELQTVGVEAFSWCEKLTKLSFPKLTTIGEYSFLSCHTLIELRLTTDADIKLDENAFAGFPNNACILYLHKNKKSDGSGTPKADADGKWGGVTWKSIVYVDENGVTVD